MSEELKKQCENLNHALSLSYAMRNDLFEQNKYLQEDRKRFITLCEQALWGLLHANPIKKEVESPYNRGYRLGWKECQKLGINLIERVIAELKS